jgi:putative adenylate-forming enzyme
MPGLKARFFDLHDGVAQVMADICAWRPDTVIAPPKVLRALAESRAPLRLRRVFSGAEVLDPLDRSVVEAQFGVPVREIYMATEGLLGVACRHGTLHLCEDAVAFEWEDVAGSELKAPVISDFVRTTQAMYRYRMNDLLRLGGPCRCGSPLQAVSEIAGRMDDVLTIGGSHTVTPDVLRNAIVDSDRRICDFRLRQVGSDVLSLSVVPHDAGPVARDAVLAVLGHQGITAWVEIDEAPLSVSARKLRRIERVWRG